MTNKIPGRLFILLFVCASFMLGKALATRPILSLRGRQGWGGGKGATKRVFSKPHLI